MTSLAEVKAIHEAHEASTTEDTPMSSSIKTADKDDEDFRTYDVEKTTERVVEHYRLMRSKQTVEFVEVRGSEEGRTAGEKRQQKNLLESIAPPSCVSNNFPLVPHPNPFRDSLRSSQRMEKKYTFEGGVGRKQMTIEEAFVDLENYIDASDPDLDLPNKLHLLQTAEGIRAAGHPEWLQLTGLLHDMGKIMFLWGTGEDGQDGYDPKGHQWALGGDTFVVGCKVRPSQERRTGEAKDGKRRLYTTTAQ